LLALLQPIATLARNRQIKDGANAASLRGFD